VGEVESFYSKRKALNGWICWIHGHACRGAMEAARGENFHTARIIAGTKKALQGLL